MIAAIVPVRILFLTTALALSAASAAVPAFPDAQGGGAAATGGRGGAVIEVTTLADGTNPVPPGSLRAALQASGPRTVVFRVGGRIELEDYIYIVNGNLTVAGQTAPGGGIMITAKNSAPYSLIDIHASNVIWRYTRIRKGWHPAGAGSGTNRGTALGISGGTLIICDHNSVSWNQDEGFGVSRSITALSNITISANLVTEGLADHSTAMLTGSDSPEKSAEMTDIDFHHNAMMNNNHRNPLLKNKTSRYVNNLHYNNRFYMNQYLGGILADVIGNVYKPGPMTTASRNEIQAGVGNATSAAGTPSLYLLGNKGWHQPNPDGDQWILANQVTGENGSQMGPIPLAWRRPSPMADTAYPIVAEPANGLEATTLPIVGASRRLDSLGNWVAARDAVDARLIEQYVTNTGITSLPVTENDVGGFPVIAGGTPYVDTDRDGMPDAWEAAHGLNPNDPADRNFMASNGYTNLENFLNGPASPPSTAPLIAWQPVSQTVAAGSTVVFNSSATNAERYQWQRNGVNIPDAIFPTLVIGRTSSANQGSYRSIATNAVGSAASDSAELTVVDAPPAAVGRLINLSSITAIRAAGDSFSMGYVVGGSGTSGATPLVLRAAGPSLGALGVINPLGNPRIELFAGATKTGENDNWGGTPALAEAMHGVGAFPFSGATSLDSAVLANITTRENSVRVSAANNGTGTVIAEIYDATPAAGLTATTPRLLNVSILRFVDANTSLTTGFVLHGQTARTVLVRAIGPGLQAAFGVGDTMADPQLTLFGASATKIGVNDNWGGETPLRVVSAAVGAFAIQNPASRDAMLLMTLAPGAYTAEVKGSGGGNVIVEVYEVP